MIASTEHLMDRWASIAAGNSQASDVLLHILERRKVMAAEQLRRGEFLANMAEQLQPARAISREIGERYILGRTRKLSGAAVMARYMELHKNVGHLSTKELVRAVEGWRATDRQPTWKSLGLTGAQIRRCAKQAHKCGVYQGLNRRRESIIPNEPDPYDFVHGAPLNSRKAGPGEIISIDPNGPVTLLCM
jgi:hypothetical protein